MAFELSQPTLGLLRRILEGMEPTYAVTPFDIKKFWKDTLFDFSFSPKVIEIAVSYRFRWGDIISDLFLGKFQNQQLSDALPPSLCEQTLGRLLALALHEGHDQTLMNRLSESLKRDGFDWSAMTSGVDSSVPAELAQIPGEEALISDIQQKLDKKEPVSVLYIDLDNFKSVNDTLGSHSEGDKCLIRIAHKMTEALLGKGKLYRPHGDEFVVVLANFTKGEATSTAERIRAAVDADNPGGSLKVTVSIGVVSSESGQADAKALIEEADKVMYVAKKKKNCVAVF